MHFTPLGSAILHKFRKTVSAFWSRVDSAGINEQINKHTSKLSEDSNVAVIDYLMAISF
jgi:hypothetical protein